MVMSPKEEMICYQRTMRMNNEDEWGCSMKACHQKEPGFSLHPGTMEVLCTGALLTPPHCRSLKWTYYHLCRLGWMQKIIDLGLRFGNKWIHTILLSYCGRRLLSPGAADQPWAQVATFFPVGLLINDDQWWKRKEAWGWWEWICIPTPYSAIT